MTDGSQRPMLTFAERLIVAMLADLAKAPNKRELNYDLISAAVSNGHSWALDWDYQWLSLDDEIKKEEVSEVVDIMDMWSNIEFSTNRMTDHQREQLAKEVGVPRHFLAFRGFDGNNESRQLSIANFLIEHLNRFTNFQERDLNSHYPMIENYRGMLAVYPPLRKNLAETRNFGRDEVMELLRAADW